MSDFIARNVTGIAIIAAVAIALALLLLVLWWRSVRNARLLSADLDHSDAEIADRDIALAEQAARLQIVREVHEAASLALTAIIRQSDATRYLAPTDPTAVARFAAQIADTARGTLADLRRIVTVAGEGEVHSAAPSISKVEELFAVMTTAGLSITATEAGERFELPSGADVAIYRILEEALANALQHGGEGTEVSVSFAWSDEGLQLLVDDNGVQSQALRQGLDPREIAQKRNYTFEDDLHALTDTPSGGGVATMRTRADAFNGVFHAYVVPGVGFSISAVFPALRYDNAVHGVKLTR